MSEATRLRELLREACAVLDEARETITRDRQERWMPTGIEVRICAFLQRSEVAALSAPPGAPAGETVDVLHAAENAIRRSVLEQPFPWDRWPKLAAVFAERPRINVYWTELADFVAWCVRLRPVCRPSDGDATTGGDR